MSPAGFGRRAPLGALAAGRLELEAGAGRLLSVSVGGRKECGVGGGQSGGSFWKTEVVEIEAGTLQGGQSLESTVSVGGA